MKQGRRRLPVVDAQGRLVGQISRCDVYEPFGRMKFRK